MQNLKELFVRTDALKIIHPSFNQMPALKILSLNYDDNKELLNVDNLESIDLDALHVALKIPNATAYLLSKFPKQISSFRIVNEPYETLSFFDIIDFVRNRPKLQQLEIRNFVKFLQYNCDNFIVIPPEVMRKLVSQRVASSIPYCNYMNQYPLLLKCSNLYFTHFDEIVDLEEITFKKLSTPLRSLLRPIKRCSIFAKRIREATFSCANCFKKNESKPISFADDSETQKRRIIFLSMNKILYPIHL